MTATRSAVSPRSAAKVGAGFLVAGVLLYLLTRVIGWGEIVGAIRTAEPTWLLLAVGSTAAGLVAWTRVWDEVLSVLAIDVPFPSLVVTYYAATFADYVTPMGKAGGGPLVAYLLSTDERITYHEGLASVASADLLNLVPLFAFAGVGTAGLLVRGGLPRRADLFVAGLVGFAFLVAAGVALVLYRREDVEEAVVGTLGPVAGYVPFVDTATLRAEVRGFTTEMGRLARRPRRLVGSLGYAFVGWGFFAAPLYLAGRSLGVTLFPSLVLFVVAASTLAGFLPTPGGLGGVEFALTGLLVALAPLEVGTAAAVALLYRVASYWFVIVVGGSFALYEIYAA